MQAPCRCMAFCLHYVTFFFCAGLRPEPAIVTTWYTSSACAESVISLSVCLTCHHQISQHDLSITAQVMFLVTIILAWPAPTRYFIVALLHLNLELTHLLTIRVDPLSHFQLFLACCGCRYSVNIFCNLFFFFSLDTQHPIALEKLPMSIELRNYLFPLSFNVLVYAHVNVGVFTRTPFIPYPVWCNRTLQQMDGATDVDAWLYFLVIKVGQNWFQF